jgi:hypothetical protein
VATLQQLIAAIEQEEGGTKAAGYALNNPGDLMTTSGNLESFGSMTEGETALQGYIQNAASGTNQNYYPGETLGEFETTYTGGDPNAAGNIGKILGVDPSTTSLASIVNNNDLGGGSPASNQSFNPVLTGIEQGLENVSGLNFPGAGAIGQGATMAKQASEASEPWYKQLEDWITSGVNREVAILVGIVLIAGAVFGFRELSTTVIQGVKKGATLAAA